MTEYGSYGTLTNYRLAQKLEQAYDVKANALDNIFAMAKSGHERFSEIVERLGSDNELVIAHNKAQGELLVIEAECVSRLGWDVLPVQYASYLKDNPRYKRVKE